MSFTSPVQQIVPAIRGLAAAVTAAAAAAGDAEIGVILGPQHGPLPDNCIMVAAPTDTGAGVLLDIDPSDQGHGQKWTLDIVVLISTWSGVLDVNQALNRVQELLDLFCTAVAENPTLPFEGADTVSVADIGSQGQMMTFNDEDGVAAEMALTVSCEIY